MKRLNKYILSALMLGIVTFTTSCEKEDFTFDGPDFVAFNKASVALAENAAAPVVVSIGAATPGGVKKDVTVTYEISGNAVEGVDYTLETPKTVTIPAGEQNASITIQPINNDQFDAARSIVLTIVSVSEPSLNIGLGKTSEAQKSMTINLVNDDCQVNTSFWEGSSITVLRASNNTTHTVSMSKNAKGECNVLSITSNAWALNAAAVTERIEFIPDSEGAKTGKVNLPKQNVGLRFTAPAGVVTVEGEGAYDETTREFYIDLIAKYEDGTVFRTSRYTFKK